MLRQRRADLRGCLVNTLTGTDPHLAERVGEIDVVMAAPRQIRGNHRDPGTAERFTVPVGAARLSLLVPASGERRAWAADGQ